MADAELQVVPSPAALPVSGPVAEPPLPSVQPPPPPPTTIVAGPGLQPKPVYETFYKPLAVGEPGKVAMSPAPGGMNSNGALDNARRGPPPTICEHQLPKSKCKKCKAMARICKHSKKKELCRECDGSALCAHDLRKKVLSGLFLS